MSRPTSTPSAKRWPPLRQAVLVWAAAWLAGASVLALGGIAVMQLGLYDVGAIKPHNPQVGWVLHNTMIHSVKLRSHFAKPIAPSTPEQIAAGQALYRTHCEECHGGPGQPRAAWTTGLTPTPPFLLDTARHWTPRELHVIVADGVKMSAMPAWSTSLSDAEIDDLVAFLGALPSVTAADYRRMSAPDQSSPPALR